MTNRKLKDLLEILDEIKKEMFMEEKNYPFSEWERSRKEKEEEAPEAHRESFAAFISLDLKSATRGSTLIVRLSLHNLFVLLLEGCSGKLSQDIPLEQ